MKTKTSGTIIFAGLYAVTALVVGYIALGIWPSLLFSLGFVGGWLLWLSKAETAEWRAIRIPFIISMLLFVLHKWEENKMDFFPALSKLTAVPVPSVNSPPAVLLLALAAAWLLIPWLIIKRKSFGYFLAWTFFASMGIIELAHFIFPIFTDQPYGYFPGMWTVIALAPVAWWGMYRLGKH